MKRWFGIGLVGVALLIAACGGDDNGGGGTLSVEQYFDRMQAIGADRQEEADAIPDPESFDEFADLFDRQADVLSDAADEVKDLNPPSEVKEAHDLFVGALEDFEKAARDLSDELEDLDEEDDFFETLEQSDFETVAATFELACTGLEAVAAANSVTANLECGDDD